MIYSVTTTSKMRARMLWVLGLILLLGFGVLIYRLFLLQIVEGEKYQSKALRQQTRSTTVGAKRGSIYDTNGDILAQSATVWNVCLSPAQLDEDTLDATASALADMLGVEKSFVLEEAKDKSSYYTRISRRVEPDLMQKVLDYITENNIDGVFFEEDTKRYYKYGSLASNLLGFTNYDNQGAYGIESRYEKELAGVPGMVVSTKNAWGQDTDYKYSQMYDAKDGNSIVLTIDEGIQHILERHLQTAVVEHGVRNRAAGIIMDIKTGAIVAMSSKPDFNPNDPYTLQDPNAQADLAAYAPDSEEYKNRRMELQYDQWRNKAISDPYEPGSVFKIVTASAAVDNHTVSLGDHFYCDGSIDVSGTNISCHKAGGHGDQDFTKAMQNSCNPAFIAIGQRIGALSLFKYMENFGLHDETGIDLPGEATSLYLPLDILNKEGMVELSSTSFGQSTKITSIQLITAVSAALNGGKLMQPYVLKQVLDPEGNVIKTTQPVVKRQVISAEASATLRGLVEAVVNGGSGRNAAIPGFRIGGKTGTSEKLDRRGEAEEVYVLSFVGFVPMEDPRYAVLVMLDEPTLGENAYGSTIAAPVVGAIMSEMLAYLGIEPHYTEEQLMEIEVEVPDLSGYKPHDAQAELTALGLQTRFIGEGSGVIRQIPISWAKMPKGGTVLLYTSEEEIKTDIVVPELVGLGAMEANMLLTDAGLNVRLEGVTQDGVPTVVAEQWPLPGVHAETGEIVIITLAEKAPDA